jgi:hypothetical protein
MAEYICSICNNKIGIGRQKLPLLTKKGEELLFCAKCYESLSKEEKLELEPVKNIKGGSSAALGFAVGGIFGALGAADQQNESIMKPIKQHNLSLSEINRYSIMNYNKHFLICDGTLKSGIMMSMGKHLKKEKLNELSKKHFVKNFDELERKEQKEIKKELKSILKTNFKNNKDLKNFKVFLQKEGFH